MALRVRKYLINEHSKLPHHYWLGIGLVIIGLLGFVLPLWLLLVGGGVAVILHDILWHWRNGWLAEGFYGEGKKWAL